jgi:hypothetical protein
MMAGKPRKTPGLPIRRSRFPAGVEVMSTPMEKSFNITSFAKIPDFYGIQPCNTEAF